MPPRISHSERTDLLARAIDRHGPRPGPPFPCPYLPERMARNVIVVPSPLAPGVYHSLMDLNFRRLGAIFYRPSCLSCEECRQVRLPVAEFQPSRAQRRCITRNADLEVEIGPPSPTEEKRELYQRYLSERHDGQMDGSPGEFYGFLYTSTVATVEISYRLRGRLVAVGVADVEPDAMSAVYCYYDPDEPSRSLGAFNILRMIDECRHRSIDYLYLGYYVRDCRRMNYKVVYRPCEILGPEGAWARAE